VCGGACAVVLTLLVSKRFLDHGQAVRQDNHRRGVSSAQVPDHQALRCGRAGWRTQVHLQRYGPSLKPLQFTLTRHHLLLLLFQLFAGIFFKVTVYISLMDILMLMFI
jgi:hypothetical protein